MCLHSSPDNNATCAVCADRRGSAVFLFGLRVREEAQGRGLARTVMVGRVDCAWVKELQRLLLFGSPPCPLSSPHPVPNNQHDAVAQDGRCALVCSCLQNLDVRTRCWGIAKRIFLRSDVYHALQESACSLAPQELRDVSCAPPGSDSATIANNICNSDPSGKSGEAGLAGSNGHGRSEGDGKEVAGVAPPRHLVSVTVSWNAAAQRVLGRWAVGAFGCLPEANEHLAL